MFFMIPSNGLLDVASVTVLASACAVAVFLALSYFLSKNFEVPSAIFLYSAGVIFIVSPVCFLTCASNADAQDANHKGLAII